MFNFIFSIYLVIKVAISEIQCECGHLNKQEWCINSGKCQWDEISESCAVDSNFSAINNENVNYCSQFTEDECSINEQCAFHLGKCSEFTRCSDYISEKCESTSYQCISNGQQCIPKDECQYYQNQQSCINKNKYGKYCVWLNAEQICLDIINCDQLPLSLGTDQQCRQQLATCTMAADGGCVKSELLCSEYQLEGQCVVNLNNQQCFWENINQQCLDKICINKSLYIHDECESFLFNCTSDGSGCIEKQQCNTYQNQNSCAIDIIGKKCIFYDGQCYQKSCDDAPQSVKSMLECQKFESSYNKCVPLLNGGCKKLPHSCDQLETQDSCQLIGFLFGKYCFWNQANHICKVKECSDAPLNYIHNQCITWLDKYQCIGGEQNGCMENKENCDLIKNVNSCVQDKNGNICMIENDICMEQKCNNLNYPKYDTPTKCQEKLKTCTYSIFRKGCVNKECNNLSNDNCDFDYQLNKCIIPIGCMHKICESASLLLASHNECQQWDIRCTVNILLLDGIIYKNGCITKQLDCSDFEFEEQCLSTLQDIQCYWDSVSKQCEFHNCDNAPITFNTISQCEQWVEYHNISCINKESGGCIQQYDQCSKLTEQSLCNLGTNTNVQCYWNLQLLNCEDRTCLNASNTFITNLQCRQWLSTCILNDIGIGCKEDTNIYQLCTDAPSIQQFNTHEECQAWNPMCTLKIGQGCANKLTCNEYLTQIECLVDLNQQPCKWDGTTCINSSCSDYPGTPGSHQDCYTFSNQCTITREQTICIDKKISCNLYTTKSECFVDSLGHKCYFTGTACIDYENQIVPSIYGYYFESTCIVDFSSSGLYYQLDTTQNKCIRRIDLCSSIANESDCNQAITTTSQLCQWNYSIFSQCQNKTINNVAAICILQNTFTYTFTYSGCKNIGSNCQLDLSTRYRCMFNDCTTVPYEYCNEIKLNFDQRCSWNQTTCQSRQCSDKSGINLTNLICINWMNICILQNNQCQNRVNCSEETQQIFCNQAAFYNGNIIINCYWDGSSCLSITSCSNISNSISHNMCVNKLSSCTSLQIFLPPAVCVQIPRNCSDIQNMEQCFFNNSFGTCYWSSNNNCLEQKIFCIRTPGPSVLASKQGFTKCQLWSDDNCVFNPEKQKCEYFQQCKLINYLPINQSNCMEYYKYCRMNQTYDGCILNTKCSDAQTFDNLDCQTFLPNRFCRLKQYQNGCQPLAQNCNQYTLQLQCKFDYQKNTCYWINSNPKCVLLECNIIEEPVSTHQDCENIFNLCTINFLTSTPIGCMNKLNNCSSYIYQEQCYSDINKNPCNWFNNQCYFDNCIISPKGSYTINDCETLYGINCTINQNRSGCIFKQIECQSYNKFQCLTPNQQNSKGIVCFWDNLASVCNEVLCQNAPNQFKYQSECESYNQNCMTSKCRMSQCSDYAFNTDLKCASTLLNNECTTNGQICVERTFCNNTLTQFGCTFSIDQKDCQWLEEESKCVDKTCISAPLTIQTHFDCQGYLSKCTALNDGGCAEITTCNLIQTKEGCIVDENQEICIWNQSNNQCINLHCTTFCGDGIVGGDEQCDDGNILPYDGCYQCKIQCQYGCSICSQSVCQECNEGYELKQKGECIEICGDGVIVGGEQCEDMNNDKYDGCYNCQFQCDLSCLLCVQGRCEQCAYGWESYNNQCRSVCGNGQVAQSLEECDDGNTDSYDGCNSICKVEQDWICSESIFTAISECIYQIYPIMKLTNISQKKDSQQIIQLTFNQELKLIENVVFEDYLQVDIYSSVSFSQLIKPIVNATLEYNLIEYQIIITLKEQIENPQVSVLFTKSILSNRQGLEIRNLSSKVQLGTPFILSESAQQKLTSAIAFNEIMIYVFIGSSSVSVLTGNFDLFFNMLALLQQLSYVRYLNVPFPDHLAQYLKVFKIVSFQPLYDKLNIDYYFSKLNYGKSPFLKGKNTAPQLQDENNAFFLVNAKSFYLTMLTTVALYLFSLMLKGTQNQLLKYMQKSKNFSRSIKFYQVVVEIRLFVMKTTSYFIYSGIIKSFISTQYQLTYSAYNQFPEYSFESSDIFGTINSVNAILAFIFPHLFLFKSISVLRKQYQQPKNKYLIFYENVKPNYWARYYIPFSMIKVNCYMGIINFLFRSPVIQVIALTLLSLIYVYYLIKVQPLKQEVESIKVIFRELAFALIVTGFFPYCLVVMNDSTLSLLGWIHIGLFSMIIASNIVLDFYKQINDLIIKYHKLNELKLKKQERMYKNNILQQFIVVQNTVNKRSVA